MVYSYCEFCDQRVEVEIEPLKKDALNDVPWGDIVCATCHFVIATISADEPGVYQFIKVAELPSGPLQSSKTGVDNGG